MSDLLSNYPHWPLHDIRDTLDYCLNFASWLDPGDTIISVHWDAPVGLRAFNDSISPDGKKVIVWISGGYNVQSQPMALLQCTITTLGGRTKRQTVGLPLGAG